MFQTPVLALPNFNMQFTVETDACAEGIGAVLIQQGQPMDLFNRAPLRLWLWLLQRSPAKRFFEKPFFSKKNRGVGAVLTKP
jgi:hypothetical protein